MTSQSTFLEKIILRKRMGPPHHQKTLNKNLRDRILSLITMYPYWDSHPLSDIWGYLYFFRRLQQISTSLGSGVRWYRTLIMEPSSCFCCCPLFALIGEAAAAIAIVMAFTLYSFWRCWRFVLLLLQLLIFAPKCFHLLSHFFNLLIVAIVSDWLRRHVPLSYLDVAELFTYVGQLIWLFAQTSEE